MGNASPSRLSAPTRDGSRAQKGTRIHPCVRAKTLLADSESRLAKFSRTRGGYWIVCVTWRTTAHRTYMYICTCLGSWLVRKP